MGEAEMDVRVRWLLLERPMPWFMLEFLVCSLVIGAMTLAAARTIPRIMQHVRVLETVALVSAAITSTMEYRAVTGAWPDGSARASMSSALSPASGLVSSAALREEGAIDYALSARAGSAAGNIVTFRAWQNSGGTDLPMAWHCGHARAAPLIASGTDGTTLADDALPSPCRARQ
jgi:type IV pilus assembly protein PilA